MEVFISIIFFVSGVQFMSLNGKSYDLKCPSNVSWKIRATIKCNSTLTYYCLYNNVEAKYVEGCTGPDWDRKGSKRIYSGSFTREDCKNKRFQPFLFWTNGSLSDCVFTKSKCSDKGQLVYKDESANDDRTCRCDHKKSFSFIKKPKNVCYCIPTEEDCSCYVKSCPVNQTVSSDYSCIKTTEINEYRDIIEYNKTVDVKPRRCMENNHLCYSQPTSSSKWRDTALIAILVCLVVGCFSAFFSSTWTIGKLQTLKRYIPGKRKEKRRETQDTDQKKFVVQSLDQEIIRLKKVEINYLRLIHLLFRVACPVVRMIFNYEIKPNRLRITLDNNKHKLEKLYRRKEKILSDYQWNLLFGNFAGKTVTSEDFGIKLMIYLLRLIANISVGDLYPVQSDTSIGAMLSRIKFIRNEVTQSPEGIISEDQFIKYWDDIGQAVLKLMSSLEMDFENYQHITGLTGVQVLTSDSDITYLITSADLLEEEEDNPNNPIEPNPKKCNVCYKEFTEKFNLSRHMKKHWDTMEKCQQCNKVFYTKFDLSRHVDSFNKHIVFECTTCQKSFKSKTGLSNNNREHSGQFRYLCTYCGEGFNYKRQFEGHKAGHEIERNFSCSKCAKSFQYENSRDSHAKLCGINKEKYIKCDQCGKAFKLHKIFERAPMVSPEPRLVPVSNVWQLLSKQIWST